MLCRERLVDRMLPRAGHPVQNEVNIHSIPFSCMSFGALFSDCPLVSSLYPHVPLSISSLPLSLLSFSSLYPSPPLPPPLYIPLSLSLSLSSLYLSPSSPLLSLSSIYPPLSPHRVDQYQWRGGGRGWVQEEEETTHGLLSRAGRRPREEVSGEEISLFC